VTTGSFNGQYASFIFDAATGDLVDAWLADVPMNGSTIELPALASDIGLAEKGTVKGHANQEFTYAVAAFSVVPGALVDTTGAATFNPFSPEVSSGDFATLAPGGEATMPLTISKDAVKKTAALGWLVASVDDANGAPQADEVTAPDDTKTK
jgi:hypothetical protein